MKKIAFSRNDGLLLLMTVIWGVNYTVVKVALAQIPPLTFNSLRLALASLLFLVTLAFSRRPSPDNRLNSLGSSAVMPIFERTRISVRDWILIAAFGVIGHFIYQICFLIGLNKTTVANSSLILGCSPVVVAMLSAGAGHERVRLMHWIGAALSVVGIYLVVGYGSQHAGAHSTIAGDLLTIGGLFCWGVYTVGAKGLLDRHSPVEVTGYSMAVGTIPFAAISVAEMNGFDWTSVRLDGWMALIFSGVFALFVAYLIWYAAVQRIGNIRTSMYSNLTPVVALVVAVVWLGESWSVVKVVGAAAILVGMVLTRLVTETEQGSASLVQMPAEE